MTYEEMKRRNDLHAEEKWRRIYHICENARPWRIFSENETSKENHYLKKTEEMALEESSLGINWKSKAKKEEERTVCIEEEEKATAHVWTIFWKSKK